MIEAEPSSVEEDPSAARTPVRHDFSVVRGFQVAAAEQGAAEAWREALKAELEARAARFHQAVDAAIVLSNDGIIRWLGDPVARLAPGPNALTPGAVILADDALPAASQEIVKTRVDLWLAATARRLLGPLFALETLQEGSAVVRDLAAKLARSLGILEREPIKREIKALAQDDRAQLRKHGVRFGAYYIFAPALIKPAPRNLALHLWSLQAPSGDADALMRVLGPLASSGRTSLPFDGEISREGYRIAGYRPCGERIVRVDVVERLASIIRAAIVEGPAGVEAGPLAQQKSKGFIVTGQMTSLTGCSGEQFGSILRSMGFQSVQMKRSDFFGSPPVSESSKEREPAAPAQTPALKADDQIAPTAACEKGTSVEDRVLSIESPAEGVLEDVSSPDMTAEDSRSDASAAEPGAEFGGSSEGEGNDEEIVASEEEETSVEDSVAVSSMAPPAEGVPGDVSAPDVTAEASASDAPAAEPGAESVASSARGRNDETIVVWRPERRAPAHRGAGRRAQCERSELSPGEHPRVGAPSGTGDVSRSPAPARNRMRNNKNRPEAPSTAAAADARKAAERPAPRADQSDNVRADKKHRQAGASRDMSRFHPGPGQQPRAKVDPNSPFAKLLELRSLLEGQANKRP
jgi:ATP-dependent RNA helicase SUPV3L1/SUV3